MFKGYIEIKDKKPLASFTNKKNWKTLDEVKKLNGYAGVLDTNTILIDVDDFNESEILLKIINDYDINCKVYETKRGKHFYFHNTEIKNCRTHAKLACGITADIKVGFTNCYGVLKNNGVERQLIKTSDNIDNIPKWMLPINTNMNFLNMEAGQGRNQALFGYILPLQTGGFSKDEAKETIRIINEYVLTDPLNSDEIEVILRDDAFSKEIFYRGKTFLFDEFAKFIISNEFVVKIHDQLHIYDNGVYVNNSDDIERKMIQHIPMLKKANRTEILNYINLLVESKNLEANENLIAFKNGVYDVSENKLKEFSPENIITNLINWDYNENAYNELTDKTLDKLACFDSEIRALLEEMIGYCFFRRNELRKAFILTGDTSNGKSTYLDLIMQILGPDNISALDLSELDQRFKTAELFGKLANIGDDIEDGYIPNTAIFKKLVSGDRINIERKGQDPFDFNNYAKLIFSANSIPRIGKGKDSMAIMNRIIIIPFEAKFSKDDPDFDPFIKYKLRKKESLEYLIKVGIEGLKRVLANGFTKSKKVEQQLKEYEETNNPIIEFLNNYEKEIENNSTTKVYSDYKSFCLNNNNVPVSHNTFSREIKKQLGFDIKNSRIGGKQYKVFTR